MSKPNERNADTDPLGVMTADYAEGRVGKRHLNYRYRVRARVAVDAFRRFHPYQREVHALEMGAADGRTLLRIRELLGGRGKFTGIEFAQELLDSAPPLPENTQLMQGNVMDLPDELEEGTYDLVTILAVLEHLTDPGAAVAEAFRMLKPGGVLVATCPNPFWDDIAEVVGLASDHHEVEVDQSVMTKLARDAGFTDIEYVPFMWVCTGALPYIGFELSPETSLRIDDLIRKFDLFDLSFVNQALIARKP
jgi:2-polyprenyl-3-methyl-5-hydroxy-6-metoxy-1,4-benzoquinol methylase